MALSVMRSDAIHVGDYVRDRANMGGRVLQLWYNWAGVEWRNGQTGWIEIKWLTKEQVASPH